MGTPQHSRSESILRLSRRGFVTVSATALAATKPSRACAATSPPKHRVAVIGHTGHGDYGHQLDVAWLDVPGVTVAAVADVDRAGLAATQKRLGGVKGYADYRKMLDEVKPDFVCIALRWLDQHRDMVLAAAASGVKGIFMEKPLCRTPAEADEMVAACQKHKVKLAVAHLTRYTPKLTVVRELIASGKLGRVLEFRARGKEDSRGGGEDLWVLGSHVLDMVQFLGGQPQWCFGSVYQKGRPITAEDVRQGNEGIGPLAGDEVHALYRLVSGATATFDSVRGGSPAKASRFGFHIFGSEGVVEMYTGYMPAVYFLPDPDWSPARSKAKWLNVSTAGVNKPETLSGLKSTAGNVAAIKDLIAAVENDRQPIADVQSARVTTEMIIAVFQSQRSGQPVRWPLVDRENPFGNTKG